MTNANQVRRAFPEATGVAPFLGWLPRKLWRKAKDFFVYSAEFLPIPASGTLTFETAIQADSDFLCVDVCRVVTSADNLTFLTAVPMLVNIFDTGSGRNIFDRPQHIDNIMGTGQLPNYWPMPKIFRANATISTTVQNFEATDRNVRISYVGFKVFDFDMVG
jgi:hypothetical protein